MTESIVVENAGKKFTMRYHRTMKQMAVALTKRQDLRETFLALDDVSFSVQQGESIGLMGLNGSGKSTLLKLVNGIMRPDSGSVLTRGRIAGLIATGAGFHPELSGRENVYLNGTILGLSHRELDRKFDEIVEFAGLERFIDTPVKNYSSGMYVRLGFSVAINVDPDVLLVDEVLAVGDEGFTHKCLDKFAEFKRRGKTILLVTHALGLVERFCDEALWLDAGRVKGSGDPKRIVGAYITDVEASEEKQLAADDARAKESATALVVSPDEPASAVLPDTPIETATGPSDMFRAAEGRWGSREVEIMDVEFTGADGSSSHVFRSGEPMTLKIALRAPLPIDDFVIGVGIFNAEGVCCYGTNTSIEDLTGERLHGDAQAFFSIDTLDLVEGTYKVDVAVHKVDGYPYDYHRLLYTFRVKSRTKDVGIYRPRHEWRFEGPITFRAGDATPS
jgi:ABC-type polysaccharide/polyol phosphate transport system ATPase subunit